MKFDSPQTLKEIAGLIHARFSGDPDFIVSGINEIHMVEPGDLTFVDHPKYYDKAFILNASTILINKEVDPPAGKALIISDHPFDDYVFLVKIFRPFEKALSAISPSATIGEGTVIQPGAFIGNHVKIGKIASSMPMPVFMIIVSSVIMLLSIPGL